LDALLAERLVFVQLPETAVLHHPLTAESRPIVSKRGIRRLTFGAMPQPSSTTSNSILSSAERLKLISIAPLPPPFKACAMALTARWVSI
jgi:hypothetical protein